MSLINQVLQDLDRRQVGAAAPVAPAGVAAARPDAHRARWPTAVAIAAAVAALALALALSGAFAGAGARTAPAPAATVASPAEAPTAATFAPPTETRAATAATPAPASVATDTLPSPALRVATAATFPPTPVVASTVVATPPVAAPPQIAPATIVAARAPRADGAIVATSVDARSRGDPAHDDTAGPPVAPERVAVVAHAPQLDKRAPPASARDRADAAYRRGLDAHRDGRHAAAESAFALAVQEDSRHAAARQALAVLLAGRQRGDAAEVLLLEGLALDARQPLLATTLARLKAGHGDVAGAIAVLEGHDGAPAQALLATLLQGAGRHGEAIERYAQALQLAPGNGSWWAGLSVSLAAVGRHDTAREALLRARASESISPELLPWIEQRLSAGTRAATQSN